MEVPEDRGGRSDGDGGNKRGMLARTVSWRHSLGLVRRSRGICLC